MIYHKIEEIFKLKIMWNITSILKNSPDFNIYEHLDDITIPISSGNITHILEENPRKLLRLCMDHFEKNFTTQKIYTFVRTCIHKLSEKDLLFQSKEIAHDLCTIHSISPEDKKHIIFLENEIFQFLCFYKKEQLISTKIKKQITQIINYLRK